MVSTNPHFQCWPNDRLFGAVFRHQNALPRNNFGSTSIMPASLVIMM